MVYHHALACISPPQAYIINRRLYPFRNDDIHGFAVMIYRNKLRMIYKANALICLQKCSINTIDGIDESTYKNYRNLCGRIRRMLIASCKTLKENQYG